jgi:uncharacterized membrane protein
MENNAMYNELIFKAIIVTLLSYVVGYIDSAIEKTNKSNLKKKSQ